MARLDLPALTAWITPAALQHPHDLPAHVAERTGVTPATARRALSRLVAMGWLARGAGRNAPWRPGELRQVVRPYTIAGLAEHTPWARDFAPCFDMTPALHELMQHAYTELVNNAVDHSGGSQVTVSMRQTATQLQLLVSDDGCGLFDKLRDGFALDDPHAAMFELAKGKLTSDAERHRGRGLHVTARTADVFQLHANASAFQRRDWDSATWHPLRALPRRGTSVYMAVLRDTPRTLDAVLRDASLDAAGYAFERTVVPMRLLAGPHGTLPSRSEARRACARLTDFKRAEIDFAGITGLGHGFADEMQRVFARAHPQVQLVPLNMAAPVAAMWASATAS